jgi:hypothetical protein
MDRRQLPQNPPNADPPTRRPTALNYVHGSPSALFDRGRSVNALVPTRSGSNVEATQELQLQTVVSRINS